MEALVQQYGRAVRKDKTDDGRRSAPVAAAIIALAGINVHCHVERRFCLQTIAARGGVTIRVGQIREEEKNYG